MPKKHEQAIYTAILILFIFLLGTTGCSRPEPQEENPAGGGSAGETAFVSATATPIGPGITEAPVPTENPTSTEPPQITKGVGSSESGFSGASALDDVATQLSMGPRTPGSPGHDQIVAWLQEELNQAGWTVEVQETTQQGKPVRNVIGRRGSGEPWIILGAHYDTRLVADQDPDPEKAALPVPGANDGASGVAVLLELARILPENLDKQIWLVFFDVEDNGNIPGWDWILGSRAFVESLETQPDAAPDAAPEAAVIVDMIGDADLNIYKERNSDEQLTNTIWEVAASLGYNQFIPTEKYAMLDDHTPFLQAGIPAIDIIDFDYPYWHTSEDTLDKISAESLMAVGDTLFTWLVEH